MKGTVVIAAMMMLVCGMPGIAEETAQSAQQEVEACADEKTEGEDYAHQMEVLRERINKLEAQYREIKGPDHALTREYERFTKVVKEQDEKASKQIEELSTLQAKQRELMGHGFEFTIVPAEQRMKYVEEGRQAMKKAVSGMEGRSTSKQTVGMEMFLRARTIYQGVKEYQEAKETFLAVLERHAKRWAREADALRKAREKKRPEDNERVQQADERGFQRMEAELKEQGKDIQKDLFTPVPSNLEMLETLCQTASTLEKAVKNERTEGQGETEEVLTELWKEMDKVAQLMAQGKAEEAEEAYRGNEAVVRFRMLPLECLGEEERGNLQRQVDALRTELNERSREMAQAERHILRSTTSLQHILENITRQTEDFESRLDEHSDAEKDKREQVKTSEKGTEGTENESETENSDDEGEPGEEEET